MKIPRKYLSRQDEITQSFLREMNKHIDDLMAGRVQKMAHLRDIAYAMCLHPVHVSNVVKLNCSTGHYLFEFIKLCFDYHYPCICTGQ